MRRSPLDDAGFCLLVRGGPSRTDLDVDLFDFADPYPNVEETIIAAETFAHRGFWSFGTEREKLPTMKGDRDFRKKRRVRPESEATSEDLAEGVKGT